MSKIALITDSHAGVRGDSLLFADYQEKFYTDIFFPTLVEQGITTIIHAGDYFDRRKYVNFNTMKRNEQMFLSKLREFGLHMHLLVGNHDVYYRNTNAINSPNLLFGNYSDCVTLVEDDVYSFEADGTRISLMPWINSENKEKLFDQMHKANPHVLVGHFEFVGFEMHRGQVMDDGMSTDDFDEVPMILSGHYHHRSTKGNVTYMGAPFEYTWSDYNDDRGFHILDTETRELEYVKNPYKMFYKFIYDDSMEKPDLEADYSDIKDRIVKLVVAKRTDIYHFDRFYNHLMSYGPHDLQIMDLEIESVSTELTEEEIQERTKDTKEFFTDYIDSLTNTTDDVKKSTKSLMNRLYVESLGEG